MCKCEDIEIGACDNQVILVVPQNIKIKYNNTLGTLRTTVNIDKCLAEEIKYLWKLGVITTGCCCGHNRNEGYIGVEDKFIPTMLRMGYEIKFNKCRPNDKDSFVPKFKEVNI